MGSGFNGQSFTFNGYLPIDQSARTAKMHEMERRIMRENQTQIFIETPYRNNKLIAELSRTLPQSLLLCVASDITCSRQSIITQPLSKWAGPHITMIRFQPFSCSTNNYGETHQFFIT